MRALAPIHKIELTLTKITIMRFQPQSALGNILYQLPLYLPNYICPLVVISLVRTSIFKVQLPSFHHSSVRCRYNSPDPQTRASKERISGVVPSDIHVRKPKECRKLSRQPKSKAYTYTAWWKTAALCNHRKQTIFK